jgi:prepilin signal peptidase PulO-like enzyme (type II secretory pathway)
MDFIFYIFITGMGLIVGSFLNVVILRIGSGLSPAKGRSQCFSCGKTLTWKELVPVFSFFVQKGKCRGCKSRISWQYPVVEIISTVIVVGSYVVIQPLSVIGFVSWILAAAFFLLLIVVSAYDIRHKLIFDFHSLILAMLGCAFSFVRTGAFVVPNPNDLLAAIYIPFFFLIVWIITRGKGIGLGDAKLSVGLAFFLGLSQGVAAMMLAFWVGTICTLGIIAVQKVFLKKKGLSLKSEVPFGPFLAVGTAIAFFFSVDMAAIAHYVSFGL